MPFQIVIVGGGTAGLSAAIALRAPNRKITILEQSRLSSEIGATFSLQPNASRIVKEEWALGEEFHKAARGIVDKGFKIYNQDGNVVHSIPLVEKKEYGGDRVMYHRQDFHRCLREAATLRDLAGEPAELKVASRVVSVDCDAGSVKLDNGEEYRADIVIAADGIHSTIRPFVLGEHITPKPTGLSAYRLIVPSELLEQQAPEFCEHIQPREPFTSMVMAHDCRLIMSAAREGEIYSVVGLVPDEKMNEDPNSKQSWVAKGDLNKALETYKDFPEWLKMPFKLAEDIGLWQLRDIDPLKTWTKGRVVLIGDAAHAMLPTQGQGASQGVEDAEALGAFFENISDAPSKEKVETLLEQVFRCRYDRASLIQRYSRETARPATEKGSNVVKMTTGEFMDYNCLYKGAKDWEQRQIDGIMANA